jgi:hypothetical protein
MPASVDRDRAHKGDPMQFIARQGDVLVFAVSSVPANLTEIKRDNGRIVLAYGEVTGHCHAIADPEASLFTAPNTSDRFLSIMATSGVNLVHEEHSTITLPVGDYVVRLQREYLPGELSRNVAD